LLWDVDATWQVFGNISRSAEVPTFDANSFMTPASSSINAQTATTYEIGTRGMRRDITWDIALYRAEVRNELQCLRTAPWSLCSVVNAHRTVHQGAEVGLGITFLKSIFAKGDRFLVNAAYTYNDFFFDGDALYGNNRLPGVPRALPPFRNRLQASEGVLRRSERRVDAAASPTTPTVSPSTRTRS
jgi:iron complex outermembrane receptor protein